MKKLVIFICVMIFCSSCRLFNEWRDGKLSVDWRVMNVTEQTLIFKYPYSSSILTDDFEFMEFEIEPMSEVVVCRGENLQRGSVYFDSYFIRSAEMLGEDVSWQISSEDGVVLKTWRYLDKDLPDQRLFKEREWEAVSHSLYHSFWVFRIRPEDIETTK